MAQTEKKEVLRAGDTLAQTTSRTNMRTPPMADGTLFGNPSNLTHRGTGFPSIPVNNVLPTVYSEASDGAAHVGQKLTVSRGAWTPEIRSFTYQWQLGGVDIAGAVGRTYIPVTGDIGSAVRCVITATNASGSTAANSSATANVAA